jgi:hypothetical protein
MLRISPTTEGFRTAFRQPSLALAEISWRWITGATATALLFFGLFEYLDSLPVTNGELLFLRSRQPYLVGQAIAHILRGSLNRVVFAVLLAALLLGLIWIVAASVGRIATVRAMIDHFHGEKVHGEKDVARNISADRVSQIGPMHSLFRLNFLRAIAALAAIFGFAGASILAGFASPDANPRPGLAFLLFLPLAALVCLAWLGLNWLLSLAALFAVRDGVDAVGAISAAVDFCGERTGAIFAVSTWTGLAHLVAFVGAMTVISMPLGFAPILPWRLVVFGMILVSLAYFVLADWLYTARLAGYVCIAEMPEALLKPLPPQPPTPSPPFTSGGMQVTPTPPVQATIEELASNATYTAMQARIQQERSHAEREFKEAAGPLNRELSALGFPHIEELRQKREYRAAIPILLNWLPKISNLRVKQSIVRALTVPWSKSEIGPVLVSEFRNADETADSYKWVVGNALEATAHPTVKEDLLELVQVRKHGTARQMLAVALGKLGGRKLSMSCCLS